ncbi:MAG: phytanoyl-CoA dioxygenase family protein [Anaerolineae bacterium]|nr:phytanoyl-CoA dioxygenase family protein [Anaerolineae bacterium]
MLTPEQIQFYQDNGYLLVKGMFSKEEAAAFRLEGHDLIERIYQTETVDATWGGARQLTAVQTKLQHCHDVQFYSAIFSRLIVDERLTGAAADIIGTPNVQLHHTKLFIKPPEKGSPFPLHQDYPFFPHDHHSMIAAIIHFDRAPEEKGCVCVVPGSHKLGPLPTAADGNHLPLEDYPLESAVTCPAEPGDVLFFSYLTIHGSGVNVSNEERTTLLVQMRDPQDPPSKLVHLSRGQGMMLHGINPAQGFLTEPKANSNGATMGPTMGGDTMMGGGMKM